MKKVKITVLNKSGDIIGTTNSIIEAITQYTSLKLKYLGGYQINSLNNGKVIQVSDVFFIRTDKYDPKKYHRNQRAGIKDTLKYKARKTRVLFEWNKTVFVLDNNLKIIKVSSPKGRHTRSNFAKEEGISDGCLKAYISRSMKYIKNNTRRKKIYVSRAQYFKIKITKNNL